MSLQKPYLSARALTCRLEDRAVLQGLDLDLYPGELVGIVGPNGAGKSTLLGCLNGTQAYQGTILVRGVSLTELGPRKIALSLALMHQNTTVSFPFSAHDVVMMGRYPHRRRLDGESSQDRQSVAQAMVLTGTSGLASQAVTKMSGGERQRVLFAKVLAQQTEGLLLDEPTANLDLAYQEQIFTLAKALAAQGRLVVTAIHDLRMAARFCTRLILLNQGRLLADGTPEQVLTPDHFMSAFGVNVHVYNNPVTGFLDYHFLGACRA